MFYILAFLWLLQFFFPAIQFIRIELKRSCIELQVMHYLTDHWHSFESGIYIEERPFTLICKLFDVHWYIIQYRSWLD